MSSPKDYRGSDFGALVRLQPIKAHQQLVQSFTLLGTRKAVAEMLEVDPATVLRWIVRLRGEGLPDPRMVVRDRGLKIRKPWGKSL